LLFRSFESTNLYRNNNKPFQDSSNVLNSFLMFPKPTYFDVLSYKLEIRFVSEVVLRDHQPTTKESTNTSQSLLLVTLLKLSNSSDRSDPTLISYMLNRRSSLLGSTESWQRFGLQHDAIFFHIYHGRKTCIMWSLF